MGQSCCAIPQSVLDTVSGYVKAVTRGAGSGLVWPALLRKIDRIDRSYRD